MFYLEVILLNSWHKRKLYFLFVYLITHMYLKVILCKKLQKIKNKNF